MTDDLDPEKRHGKGSNLRKQVNVNRMKDKGDGI